MEKIKKNTRKELDKGFEKECKVIELKYEYKGYSGMEKYAIVTALSIEILEEKYKDEMGKYQPFLLLSQEQGAAIFEFRKNEKKHEMRQLRKEAYYGLDIANIEPYCVEMSRGDVETEVVTKCNRKEMLLMLDRLTEVQKRRMIKYYFEKKTYREIGIEEGVSHVQIKKSIDVGIEKIKKIKMNKKG